MASCRDWLIKAEIAGFVQWTECSSQLAWVKGLMHFTLFALSSTEYSIHSFFPFRASFCRKSNFVISKIYLVLSFYAFRSNSRLFCVRKFIWKIQHFCSKINSIQSIRWRCGFRFELFSLNHRILGATAFNDIFDFNTKMCCDHL